MIDWLTNPTARANGRAMASPAPINVLKDDRFMAQILLMKVKFH